MATTHDNMKDEQDAYGAAFNEEQPAQHVQTEDEAFGISPEEAKPAADQSAAENKAGEDAADGESGDEGNVAIVIDGGELKDAAEQENAEASAQQAAAAQQQGESQTPPDAPQEGDAGEVKAPAVDMEKETQRLKSWEGRLKAMEAKLKAAGADTPEEQKEAVGEAIEDAAEKADTPAAEEQVEQIAEQVEKGELTPEEAMKQLEEDFGSDFVKMIEIIATQKAKEAGMEATAELGKTVSDIIDDMVDSKAKAHFAKIEAAHPDFNEIGQSEQFKQFIDAMPEDKKQEALSVIGNGSADQINQLLDGFKQATAAGQESKEGETELAPAQGESIVDEAAESNEDQLDAAEGVRSSGMKLPESPASADNYEDAWNQA
ncbi:type II secretion system F family protein [Polynucleobacter sp. UK-Kesae-W10]|uniref:type II secretion system F family protein n=1 Tax=Polynucleobacter sp. UK-Kesae-W10 TaxID=1819738 RepID=UPI001C0DCBCB|nr:type II secretion system F family protein [Polynucleobacter sp. UK-Kesae-W10]MBU3577574.1 hypothetical protein [Polynucleobacter sp. UK-Kesae-W10]